MRQMTFIIGRNPNVSRGEIPIAVNDPSNKVSGNHCRIYYDDNNFFIEDLISTNGTYVNGSKIIGRTQVDYSSSISLGRSYALSLSILNISNHESASFSNQNSEDTFHQENNPSMKTPSNQLFIEGSVARKLPSMVRNELSKMSAQKQQEYMEEYNRNKKSTALAYVFLIFIFAMHYGYLRKWGLQVVFWITAGGFGFWWFIDWFRTYGMVESYNKDKAIEVMRNLKATSTINT